MVITNIESYLSLIGLLVDYANNDEQEIDYPYIGRLSQDCEFIVECELDLLSLCNDYNININDISNIKLTLDGVSSNIRRFYFCNSDLDLLQSFDNNGLQVLNLGYLKNNNKFGNELLFYIRSSEDYDYELVESVSCEIITNYTNNFDNKPFYKTKLLNESINNLISYQIDIYKGRIDFSKEVASLYGNKMPLHISQTFNPFKDTNYFDNWKLNLEQKIYFNNNKYYWIDNNYKTHKFEGINNSLFFDTEHTGLLLRILANEYVITNDIDKFYHFDTSMNLVSIESKRGVDSLSLQISQSSNSVLFTDGMGRVATYSSNNNGHNLVLPDSTTLSFAINLTNDVFTNLDGSQVTYNYATVGNVKLLCSAVSTYGNSITFTYDENFRIIKIEEFCNNLITKRILFEYFEHYVIITNIRNPHGLLITSRTGYTFSKDGSFISEIDLLNYEHDNQLNVRYYNQESYEQFSFAIRSGNAERIERVQGTNYFGINTTSLNSDEEYVVYAKLNCNKLHISSVNTLEIDLVDTWPACHFVRQLFFVDYSFDGDLILATKIRPSDYTNEYIILEVIGNYVSLIDNNTFFLIKTKKNSSFDIVKSSSQNSGDFSEIKGNSTIYWNKIYSLVFSNRIDCEKITPNDYKVNFYNLARNNGAILWYNDLSKAFIYSGNSNVLINENEQIEVSNLVLGHLDINLSEKKFSYLENSNENDFYYYTVINTNWSIERGLVKQKKDCYGNAIYEEDSLGNCVYYVLDNYGRTISISKATSLGTFKNEYSFTYSTTEFSEIFVDEDGLIYEKTFDLLTGLLKSSKEPNGNYTYYLYDSSYRLINVSSSNNSNSITYNQDEISSLSSSEGNNFSFSYNGFKEIENVRIDNTNHLSNNNVKTPIKECHKTLYSNSKGNINIYNRLGKLVQTGSLTSLTSNGLISVNNIYGSLSGNYSNINTYNFDDENISTLSVLRKTVFTNLTNSYTINYYYNSYGKIQGFEIPNNYSSSYIYSIYGSLIEEDFIIKMNNQNINSSSYYTYLNIDALNKSRLISFEFSINDFSLTTDYSYDNASRVTSKEYRLALPFEYGFTSITYENTYKSRTENNTTLLSNKLISRNVIIEQDNFEYDTSREEVESFAYNNNGILESITINGNINKFTYDNLSRLIREDNEAINRSFTYTYNNGGNITSKSEYMFSTGNLGTPIGVINYGYNTSNHKDQLISWNGYTFVYDGAGNPTTYKGSTLTRNNYNKLSKYLFNSTKYIDFEYNGEGVRREKVVVDSNSTTRHTYTYYGSKLLHENITGTTHAHIVYIYENDEIIGFYLDDLLPYLFRKNILGDVVEIYDYLGVLCASYEYDAWGNCEVISQIDGIADLNPIRYRSYYFDKETGLYYLINRYYDPETGRFISPDSIEYLEYQQINGVNFYCYCLNDPINKTDKYGNSIIGTILNILLIFVAVAIFTICTLYLTGRLSLITSYSSKLQDVPRERENNNNKEFKGISDSHDFGSFTIYYELTNDYSSDFDDKLTSLKIYDSYKYSSSQIKEFLERLKKEYPEINVGKMLNEWARHALAYRCGFNVDSSKDADIYFNSDDVNHKYSFIINMRIWY